MTLSDESEKALLEQIKLGRDVKNLVQNKTFMAVMDRLKQRRDAAANKLLEVDLLTNLEDARKLQNAVWRHDELAAELYSIIEAGMLAEEELAGNLEEEL